MDKEIILMAAEGLTRKEQLELVKRLLAQREDRLAPDGRILHSGFRAYDYDEVAIRWWIVLKEEDDTKDDVLELLDGYAYYRGPGAWFQDRAMVKDMGSRWFVKQRCGYDV